MAKKIKQVNLDFLGLGSTGSNNTSPTQESLTTPGKISSNAGLLSGMFNAGMNRLETQARPISIEALEDNPYQPRKFMADESLEELADVIRRQGFQGVLVARPHIDASKRERGIYQLTAGHRRREASKRAGLVTLPIIVRELSDEEMAFLAITENIQREDLTPLEEGRIFLLMSKELGYTHEQIAKEISKNRGYVENRLRVARAPEDIQELVRVKPDSLRAVATLIKVKDPLERQKIIKLLQENELTADDLPGYLESLTNKKENSPEKIASVTRPTVTATDVLEASTPASGNITPTKPSPKSRNVEPGVAGNSTTSKVEGGVSEVSSTERVSVSKLATVLRTLQTYRQSLEKNQRTSLSEAEKESITEINEFLSALVSDYFKD